MQVAVERRPGSQVALTVTVEPTVLEAQIERLFQKHARRVSIPGFRPGKAPRKMLEERINRGALMQDAVEDVIDSTYKEALREEHLEPLERGEIEDLNTAEDLTLTYTVLVSVRPEITLPNYMGLHVTHTATVVDDAQVDAEIERLRERTADFAEITDEGIQTGDYVTVDYTMTVDGAPYPEGDTTGYPLEVGSDTFFPELNERLLGVKQGETVTVSKSYPADYSNEELAGKSAEFEIVIQQVRRVVKPEATDAWAQMLSQGALETMADLRGRLQQNLQVVAAESDHDHIRSALVRQVVDGAELDIPDTLVNEQFEHQMHDMEHRLAHERMSLEEYAEVVGRSVDDMRSEQRLLARDMVRRSLVLQEIARREKLAVTDEDVDAVLAASAQNGKSLKDVRRELERSGRFDHLVSRLFHEKVLGFLEQHADIRIQNGTEEPATAAVTEAPAQDAAADPPPAKRTRKPRSK